MGDLRAFVDINVILDHFEGKVNFSIIFLSSPLKKIWR